MELDSYTFVLLKRGPRALEFSDEELERLQEQHLAHLRAMTEQGHLLIAARSRSSLTNRSEASVSTAPISKRRGALPSPTRPSRQAGWRSTS